MSNLCQLSDLKVRLGVEEFETGDDARLEALIAWVSARFDKETGRTLARGASITEQFGGADTELILSRYPVESVASFHVKENETDGWEAQTGVDYLIRNDCIISLSAPLSNWRAQLRVTYTAGYVLPGTTPDSGQTALPDDLEQAAIEQCAHWWKRREHIGLASISGEGGAITQFGKLDLLPHVMETLSHYRRMSA